MDTLALTESTDTGVAASPMPSRRPNLVCFPLYRDRLACDPQNCLCVYESHEFKWGDTVTNSEQTIRSLVDAMVLSARRAFTNSLAYWRQLPVTVQRALALRSALALQPTALHTALAHVHPAPVASLSFYPVSPDTASGGQRMNHRKSIGNHLSGSVLDSSALAGGGGPRQNRVSVMGTSQTRRCMRERHEEETTMINAIVGLWEPPQNGPRCRIVIDIVASRKTIGEEPQNSEPYRLGQYIYRYIQEQYPADGMNVFVGITDCAMTLIGRDILFPYRITGTASGAGSAGRVGRLRNAGPIAAAATAESLIMSMPTGVAPSPMNLEHVLANIIPPPCAITTPATKIDKVDNVRLIVCYPSSNEGVWGSRHNHFHYHRHRMISCCGGAALCTSVRCVSLSELAKAFAEMSESNATTPVSSTTNATAATQMASSLASSSIHNSRDSSMLSLEHDATLRALTGPRLSAALDAACRQNHRVHVMQCLTELCRRLREAPPSEFIITEDEASGAVGIVPDNAFRSDRLLEGILRALARSDLDAVVGKSGDWIAEFCALLMQWLCARAASLDAVKSGIFLHLLAQQKALHCEAALATLRDNVEVHLRRAVEGQGSGSGSGSSNNRGNGSHSRGSALDLSVYSVILDAIARWQLGVVRLIAMESSSVAARRDALDEVVTLNDYYDSNHGLHIHHNNGGAELHIAQCGHPVLSADFYNAVVSSLLRDVRSGSVSLTQRCSPTTFFFLTLALAKIRWLHTECVAVLLPQFHDALRVFPAQFLGVVLLLGRREVNVCDVATTDLLLQTVLDSMQRRGRSFAANPSSTAASGGSGSSNSSSSSGGGGSSSKGIHNRHQLDATAFRAVASGPKCSPAQSIAAVGAKETAMGGEDWCATGNEEDAWKQDDEDLLLFSPVARSSALSSSASSSSSSSLSSQALVPMTSLLDVRTLPVFLDSLRNILTTTIEHCAAQSRTAEAAAINAKAATLFEAIMRDTHNGVKSIQTLVDRPVMTEKLLNAFVRLPLEEHLFHHPLFVELTYAFTRHIGRRRSVLSSNAGKGIPLWQRRAAGLAELLVERGLLTQDTFLMSDAVVASAPRVAEAVAAEKERMQRIREERAGRTGVKTQQQQEEQQKQGEETSAVREDAAALKRIHTPVRTSAVFAGFSRVMRHIQHHLQQQREMTAQRGRVSV